MSWLFSSVGDFVQSLIVDNILVPICEWFLNAYLAFVTSIASLDILSSPLNTMLGGSASGTSLYSLVTALHDSVIVPIAHSILALVLLVQLVKISQRIDSTATMPAVKEVLFLVVFCAMFMWLINNSTDILVAVYNQVNVIVTALGGSGDLDLSITIGDTENLTIGAVIGLLAFTVIGWVLGFIALIVSYVMAYFRAIQLYIYMAFAPIPFAFLGFEETRSFGINFCKNFIAVCLAGAVMVFALVAFPALAATVVTEQITLSSMVGFTNLGDQSSSVFIFIKLIALTIVLIWTMCKSGAIARDILGG